MYSVNIKPSSKQAGELCNLSRKQPKNGMLTGHFHLKGHLFKLGLVDGPQCNTCKQASETAFHILCDYDALAVLRYRHLGHQSFLETRLLCQILHQQGTDCTLFQVCGGAKCLSKGLHKRWGQSRCKGHCSGHHTLLYCTKFVTSNIPYVHSRQNLFQFSVWCIYPLFLQAYAKTLLQSFNILPNSNV